MHDVGAQFHFGDSDMPALPVLVAEVSKGIRSKAALLDQLAEALRFPDYFGGNWDAMEECIRDLSWLPPGPVVLKHNDLPLVNDVANLRTYLAILWDAVGEWSDERVLVVAFPRDTRDDIARLL